jgi:hypothetical protein
MTEFNPPDSTLHTTSWYHSRWVWFLVGGCLLVILIGLLLPRGHDNPSARSDSADAPAKSAASNFSRVERARLPARRLDSAPAPAAAKVVANKLSQFARNRRAIARAMARRAKIEVPGDVERFFDAVEAGNWDEIEARFKVISGGDASASGHSPSRPPGVEALWPAIIDTYGVAEQVHLWPAQKLLDYGNAVLDSLRPGMVYVGGTDPGRWIPTLLNETSDGERHIVVTQNGLAAGSYLDYVNLLYGDRLTTLTQEDSQRVFKDYIADAQKRLQHDQQFPDEPKQIRPGEDFRIIDGRVQVSGQVAVMAINERLLQSLMEKNPSASFALEESFSLKSTYPDAAPLGPIMELRVQDRQGALTAERAAQSVEYWRATTQQLLSDPEATGSSDTLKTYSKMATAQANLFASHSLTTEAEQAYRIARDLWPGMPEAAFGLSELLARTGRADEARRLLDDFAHTNPDQRAAVEAAALWRLTIGPQSKPPAPPPRP